MTDKELFGNSDQLNCSDCVNHGGDWDCDHVHCRKGTDTISRRAALKGLEDLNIASFYEDNEHSKGAYMEVKAMLKVLPSATDTNVGGNLIDRQAAVEVADAVWTVTGDKNGAKVWQQLKDLPTVDAVPVAAYEQVRWERDIALGQLKQLGYELGEKVVPVAHGKWIQFPTLMAYKCSECGRVIQTTDGRRNVSKHYPFCHCGARMDGKDGDDG